MRFVRHAARPEWGLGVVASEDEGRVLVLFVGSGYFKCARDFASLTTVPDGEVPPDHPLRKREDWPRVERDGKREQAKRDLPKRFEAFVEEFLRYQPHGLRSAECDAAERDYKVKAVEYARQELAADALHELLAGAQHSEIVRRTRRVLGKVNLAFPNELMKFDDIPASVHRDVAEHIVRLATAGEGTPAALEDFAGVLAPHGAAKWTICSLIPFLLEPEEWPFVKPTAIERTAKATGFDVEYDPKPNARTYGLVRDLYKRVAELLGERGFAPRDHIDVQTFLWIASGMARESDEKRDGA